jgi:hypothetical protein
MKAIEDAFSANVDFAMLIETYQKSSDPDKRYSLGEFVNALPILVTGNPKADLFSTSHFEGQNLAVKMQLHRFTRLTNAYSNKLSHLKAALALHFTWYNYRRVATRLRVIQAMAAGDCNEFGRDLPRSIKALIVYMRNIHESLCRQLLENGRGLGKTPARNCTGVFSPIAADGDDIYARSDRSRGKVC